MLYNVDRWESSEVWFCPEFQSWVVTGFSWDGSPIDGSDYSQRKAEAVETATLYMESDRCDKVVIFGKDGREQRTIKRRV